MPVARNQIGELVDILEHYVSRPYTVDMLSRMSHSEAAIQNAHFRETIDRMVVEAQKRLKIGAK
jgi:hypothetical protein